MDDPLKDFIQITRPIPAGGGFYGGSKQGHPHR